MEYNSVKQLIRSSLMVPSLDLNFAATKELDSRIQYSRGTGGTFIGPSGLVEYAPENLILRSEEFTTTWIPSGATVTQIATTNPFGSLTAFKLEEDNSYNFHEIQQDVSLGNQMVCFSVYGKAELLPGEAGGHIALSLGEGAGYKYVAYYGLTDGTVVSTTNQGSWAEISAGITDVGGGWYRCFIVGRQVTGAFTRCRIGLVGDISGTLDYYQGDPSSRSGMLIWGAQLQRGSSATEYLRTTTSAAYSPRFTHDPITGASLGLLIEESRTNLLPRSEQFDTAPWSALNGTATPTPVLDPAGGLAADSFIENTASGNHQIFQTLNTAIGVQTFSIFVKAAGRTSCQLLLFNGTNGSFARVNVDLNTGALSSVIGSASVQQFLNGWWRVSVTGTSTVLASSANLLLVNGGATSYLGDGASGVLLYGAQLEAGAFASSYIPTISGTGVRGSDIAIILGTNFSSCFKQKAGTIVVNYAPPPRPFPSSSRYEAVFRFGPAATDRWGLVNGGSTANYQTQIYRNATFIGGGASVPQSSDMSYAFAWDEFGHAQSYNGTAVTTGSLSPATNVNTEFSIGTNNLCGTIARIRYYPLRLPNSALQTLTT
jgi:hypothetical protein